MFKKLIFASTVLALASQASFAQPYYPPTYGPRPYDARSYQAPNYPVNTYNTPTYDAHAYVGHRYDYKGEQYKEMMPPQPPCAQEQHCAMGPYIGIGIGPQIIVTGTPTAFEGFQTTGTLGFMGNLQSEIDLAGEIFAQYTSNLRDYPPGGSAKVGWSAGVGLLPGFNFTPDTVGYFRIGAVESRYRNYSQTVFAWQTGVGLWVNLFDNWSFRGEYVYSLYNRISAIGRGQSHTVNVGLYWKFF